MVATITMMVLSAVFATVFSIVRAFKGGPFGVLTKTIASLSFIALAVTAAASVDILSTWMLFIVLGGVFGLVGDIYLNLKALHPESMSVYQATGMTAFGIGHIVYFIAIYFYAGFFLTAFFIALGIALLIAFGMVFGAKLLKLHFGQYVVPVAVYTFFLAFLCAYTVSLSVMGIPIALMAAGSALFLLSDFVLAPMYFGGKQKSIPLSILNHALYYGAQICIAGFIFFSQV